MGMCGSDPRCLVDGGDHLSAANQDEKDTLRRLGLTGNWRMACMARVQGPVTGSLTATEDGATEEVEAEPPPFALDPSVQKMVIM